MIAYICGERKIGVLQTHPAMLKEDEEYLFVSVFDVKRRPGMVSGSICYQFGNVLGNWILAVGDPRILSFGG
ncbi:MAG TPA: hypothetical protein VFF30_12295 [Nitrososphaerales archaeon]|nr:hypothetical protein [Nitrososphaerales archaeon]